MNMRRMLNFCVVLWSMAAFSVLAAEPAGDPAGYRDDGIWLGPVKLSPALAVGVFYDSNPDQVNESRRRLMEEDEDSEDDRFESTVGYNIKPGLVFSVPGNRWSLDGACSYRVEKDDSDYSREPKDWLQSLQLKGRTDGGTTWGLGESTQQLSYEKFDEFSQEDRFSVRFTGFVGKELTEKTRGGLDVNYNSVEYDDEAAYDAENIVFALNFSHRLTEKTDGIVSARYSIKGTEEAESNAHTYNLSVGLGAQASHKLAYRLLIGVSMYSDFEYEDEDDSSIHESDDYSDTDTSASYDLGVRWRAAERLDINVSGGNSYEAAEDVRHNSLLVSTLMCSADYRMFQRWKIGSGIAYRHEDYLRDVAEGGEDIYTGSEGEGKSRKDNLINVFASIVFGMNRYASLFAHGQYSVTNSSIEDFEYDRYRISAGVALQY